MIQNELVTEAIEYILWHIWDELCLERVAAHCHVSVSHLSRLFREQTGQSVYAFIKRVRIEQSAMKLKMERDRVITDIGWDYGYSSSNYSAAFRGYFHQSPSAFRSQLLQSPAEKQQIFDAIQAKVRIETRPEYRVMYERTIGSYSGIRAAWCDFIERHRAEQDKDTIFFDRTFDDPQITPQNRCLYDICMTTPTPERYPNWCVLPGGRFAVYPFQGYLEQIYPLHQQLVGIWFPFSHHQIDARYAYDQYHEVRADGFMRFDICIPVK